MHFRPGDPGPCTVRANQKQYKDQPVFQNAQDTMPRNNIETKTMAMKEKQDVLINSAGIAETIKSKTQPPTTTTKVTTPKATTARTKTISTTPTSTTTTETTSDPDSDGRNNIMQTASNDDNVENKVLHRLYDIFKKSKKLKHARVLHSLDQYLEN